MGIRRGPNIVTDGLVFAVDAANPSSYPGSGTIWKDQTVNQNNGTLTNGPTFNSDDQGSIDFDGVNDVITINQIASYSSDDPHTYSAWVNADSTTSYKWILNNGAVSTGTSLIIYGNKIGFFWKGGTAVKQGILNVNVGTWYNLTVCYNGSSRTYDMYVNGVLDTSSDTSSPTAGAGASWSAGNLNPRIGSWYNGNFDFNGKVSNTQIYNRALSSTEVAQNYNALKGRFGL
jgi:hypothetical protein